MPPCFRPACFKRALLALLASLAPLAWAEPFSASAQIVAGDVGTARSEAVREILWEAGMRGGAVVHSQSALIGGSLHETTLVRSAFRIKRFQILHEEIADDRLRLTADIEQEEAAAAGCAAALPLQNIAYAWEGIVGGRASEADDQAGMVLGTAIGRELRASAASYLQTPGAPQADAIYRIGAALELPGHAAAGGVLRLQLRGATVDRLIKEIRLPAGPSPLARQEESNLGYALLRQWVPTAATRQLAGEAARQLAETVRCLPALLRIPRLEPDGGFSLTTRAPLDLGQRGLVLFFAAWPVAEGGTVDLLQADGYLKPQQVDDHSLRFPGGPRQPGKKYPLGGGYLLVL